MTFFLAASLFFTTPAPLDMPRAEAYLVKEADGTRRLEDRYHVFDLWLSRAVLGRWIDDDFRVFTLSRLDVLPPALSGGTATRVGYASQRVVADRKNDTHLARMIDALSPVQPSAEYELPRYLPRGVADVRYWQGTNRTVLVCSFLPRESPCRYLAVWELAETDSFEEARDLFEKRFLDERAYERIVDRFDPPAARPKKSGRGKRSPPPSERTLLRADARRSVAAYPAWHATDAEEFSILDALPGRGFTDVLTNDLRVMRAVYAATVPSPVDGSNTLAVARIFANRDDYLEAAGEEMAWSAAYWSPRRRELVAYLSPGGERELLRTIRHEAFHQYLSYACAMIPAAPWFNEGYAQYFEDMDDARWEIDVDLDRFEGLLPAVLTMDYAAFYAGTDLERRVKYRLAWSIVRFLEKGAPEVRFEPFKTLKTDYIEALLKTHDMHKATSAAFGSHERLKRFVFEWKKYWRQNM